MQPMTVQEIAAAVDGVWLNPGPKVPVVRAVCTDSHLASAGGAITAARLVMEKKESSMILPKSMPCSMQAAAGYGR